jgi:ABC-type sugar transport system substrate-binding protein
MQKTIRMTALAALFAAAPLGAAFAADRAPSADETAIISNVLLDEGFTSWGKIEWDDNEWRVKNAVDQDGKRHDLVLDSQFYIVNADSGLVRLNLLN